MTLGTLTRTSLAMLTVVALAIIGCGPAPRASTTSSGPGVTAGKSPLPARADACTTDDECSYSTRGPEGRDLCCNTYELYSGTKEWSKSVEAYCTSRPAADCAHIPTTGPSSKLPNVACVDRRCKATM